MVSGKDIIAIASVVYSDIFKSIQNTATQMIAHHSVNFDPILNSSTILAFQ